MICDWQRLRKECILKYIKYGWIILTKKLVHVARAFVPAVLLGEAEPKGVAEASQKAAEHVVSIYLLCLHILC